MRPDAGRSGDDEQPGPDAVLAPTDAAAVFSVLRKLPLPPRLSGMLEGESGLNDPPAVLAVTLLSDVGHHPPSPALLAGEVVYQLAAGAAIGLLAGQLGALALRRVALPASGLYLIAILALIVASYGSATLARASGFLAVYVSALVLGNAQLPHGPAIRGFAEGVAWLAQIGLFVMLGLLASPARLPAQILPAIAAGAVVMLVARPAAVAAAALPLRVPWRQQAFMSWAGLRGAVPIVLATIPMNARVPGATRLFDIVFIIVVLNTLAQGPTLPWVARRLKVTAPAEPPDVACLFENKPESCPFGHQLWPGKARVSWTPCICEPAREAAGHGRGMGHVQVACNSCHDQLRQTVFFEPPHDSAHQPLTGWVAGPDLQP